MRNKDADTKKIAACKTLLVHEEIVNKVIDETPDEERLVELADFFKVLGDSGRMKIIHALFISELCVCDIAALTGGSPSAISHQLKILRSAGLVKYRKDGKTVFYSLHDEHITTIVALAMQHLSE